MRCSRALVSCVAGVAVLLAPIAAAAQDSEDLAKQLANPVASLISLPIDVDVDSNIGPCDDGDRFTVIAKPVVPTRLNARWDMISRTIVPAVVSQEDIFLGAGGQTGFGDLLLRRVGQRVVLPPVCVLRLLLPHVLPLSI